MVIYVYKVALLGILLIILSINTISIGSNDGEEIYYKDILIEKNNRAPSIYVKSFQDTVYMTINVPDYTFRIPSINHILYGIRYNHNLFNDNVYVPLRYRGKNYLLVSVFTGLPEERDKASFDVYLIDLSNMKSSYIGNLKNYGIVFPRIFKSFLYYGLYPINNTYALLWVYIDSNKTSHLILINPFMKNIVERYYVARNLVYYKYFTTYNVAVGIMDNYTSMNILLSHDPFIQYYNGIICLKNRVSEAVVLISSRILDNKLFLYIPYVAGLNEYIDYYYILVIDMNNYNYYRIYQYRVDRESAKYMYPYRETGKLYFYNKSILFPYIEAIEYHNIETNSSLLIARYSTNFSTCSSAFYLRQNTVYVLLTKSDLNNNRYCTILDGIEAIDLSSNDNKKYIQLSGDINTLYDGISASVIENNETAFLLIPFYKISEDYLYVTIGLRIYYVKQNGFIYLSDIVLEKISVTDIPKSHVLFEIEIHSSDIDHDHMDEILVFLNYYMLNHTYRVHIFLFKPWIIYNASPLPELSPGYLLLIFLAVLLLIRKFMVLNNR